MLTVSKYHKQLKSTPFSKESFSKKRGHTREKLKPLLSLCFLVLKTASYTMSILRGHPQVHQLAEGGLRWAHRRALILVAGYALFPVAFWIFYFATKEEMKLTNVMHSTEDPKPTTEQKV